ncbi:peptidase M28 [Caulobacter segnis]|uniref:Carboxypeptidase Q n=2 Tax=Caulobacter segnis TaxID=88688 RepID=D5VLP0_CAUST|nr:M20/M25/M40 family metallo-hydrolase [Caulobacter segnis]ADG11413.1 peptidase M28 [Caulobacter segnis ATCC 21756]AVQ03081.1 peptidase M28 [Caulobacter segnis]
MLGRRARLLAIWVLAAVSTTALGQAAEIASSSETPPASLAYDLVRDLTTLFGPRPAGSAAEAAAARWGSDKMKALGFQGVTIEPFPLLRWTPGETRVELIGDPAQRLVATPLGGLVAGPPVEAPVALFRSYDAFLKSSPAEVRGRIVAVVEPVRRAINGDGYVEAAPARARGPAEAMARGAVGFVVRSLGTHQDNVANSGASMTLPRPFPAFALSPAATDQIERAAGLGPVRMRLESSAGWAGAGTSQNVVGTIPGSDPDAAPIIIGAHLDSWEQGTGAIDDGFGIAAVTAAATRILRSGKTPRHTIHLVWFGAEEVSQPGALRDFVGARAFTARHASDVKRALVVAESDWGGGRVTRVTLPPGTSDETVERVRGALGSLGLPVAVGGPGPGVAEIGVLAAAGAPLLRLHQDATGLFDVHHTPNDVLSRVDPASLEQNVTAWERVISAIADVR